MSKDAKDALLLEAMNFLHKCKDHKGLWNGNVGFSPSEREDVNDLLAQYRGLPKANKS